MWALYWIGQYNSYSYSYRAGIFYLHLSTIFMQYFGTRLTFTKTVIQEKILSYTLKQKLCKGTTVYR
jgi:hypothetical protein